MKTEPTQRDRDNVNKINRKLIALFTRENAHPAVASAAFVEVMASILVMQTVDAAGARVGADTISAELHKVVERMIAKYYGTIQ
jgi:hypothetical protein